MLLTERKDVGINVLLSEENLSLFSKRHNGLLSHPDNHKPLQLHYSKHPLRQTNNERQWLT